MFDVGDYVQTSRACRGMAAGSLGIVAGCLPDGEVLVRFWDGGPIRVPAAALELVDVEAGSSRGTSTDD